MNKRPPIQPSVVATITERAPARLVKKLDANPSIADGWAWEASADRATVVTESGERVVVTGRPVVDEIDAITCSCLLSPKCFHVLAVVTVLPLVEALANDDDAARGASAPDAAASEPAPASRVLDDRERAVARRAVEVLGRTLEGGLSGVGAFERAELLRLVHSARVAALHRLAARTLAFAEAGRALRERSAAFELEEAVEVLGDALRTAIRLERGNSDPDTIGVARRAYEPIGALRLFGLASEPIVTRSGYSGIVTYVANDEGHIYTIEDVMPGDARRAAASYEATVRLGETAVTHRELTRVGLFVAGATASHDRRLGAGASVYAVTSSGVRLDEAPLAALFEAPLAVQIARALDRPRTGLVARAASLVFLQGTIAGSDGRSLLLDVGSPEVRTLLRLGPRVDDSALPTMENLRVLSRAVGARVRVIGHLTARQEGRLELVALGHSGPGIALPAEMGGKINVGLDRLSRSQAKPVDDMEGGARQGLALPVGIEPALVTNAPMRPDVVAPLERRIARLVIGGRRSLGARTSVEVDREVRSLTQRLAPTAAGALRSLAVTSATAAEGPRALAEAWLRAFVAADTLRRALARDGWRQSCRF